MRKQRLEVRRYDGKNALRFWPRERNPAAVAVNTLVLNLAKYLPLRLKNSLLRLLGVEVGRNVSIGLEAMFDIFHPGKISIGENTTVGYGAVILAHETTRDEFRVGEVEIGKDVLIGAKTTVLPGVRIGDGARVSANSLVNRDVEEGEFVGGVPVREIDQSR